VESACETLLKTFSLLCTSLRGKQFKIFFLQALDKTVTCF